jgi:hypothetical protein
MSGVEGVEREDHDEREAGVEIPTWMEHRKGDPSLRLGFLS